MRILVTGASGFIGSLLIPRLNADGHDLRAVARDPARVDGALRRACRDREIPPIEVIRGDLLTGEGLARAMDGVDVAYYLIHSMEAPGDRGQSGPATSTSFSEREILSAQLFADRARRAGVARIVYLGGTMPSRAGASRHLASRAAVGEILTATVPDTVTLRASIVIGARSRSFRFLVHLVERLPILALPPWRDFRSQPIDARDVIAMLSRAATDQAVAGETLDVGGPEMLSYGEIITRIADLMLVSRPALGISAGLPPVIARLAASITREDPDLIVPLMESLRSDLLADPPSLVLRSASRLGVRLHPFDAAVERALREWEAVEPLAAR